jgi:hypothetical protein
MNICLKAYKIKSVLFVHAQTVFEFLAYLIKEKKIMKFLLASLKTLTIDCSESRFKFLLWLSFSYLSIFSIYVHGQLSEQLAESCCWWL